MSLKIKLRGKTWHYTGTIAGRRLRGSTGATDKAIAQRIADEIAAKAWRSHLDGPGAHVTMAQAAIEYRKLGKNLAFLEPIEDYWKDTPVSHVTPGMVRQMALEIYDDHANSTVNRQGITPTQAMINHIAELGWCSRISVKRFSEDKVIRYPASSDWVRAFADQALEDGLEFLAALCLFMYGTGARISEALAVKWGDIDLEKRRVFIKQTKTGAERWSHLQSEVLVALANLPSNRNPEDAVFPYAARDSVYQTWHNVILRAKIAYLTPHCCRHGFATNMLRAGYDVKTVAKLGGWKNARTVLDHYAHALEDLTVTDALFGTNQAQEGENETLNAWKKKENLA